MAAIKARIFLLRGDDETGPKKIYVGDADMFDDEDFLDTGVITEQLFLEHPEKGDVEITEPIRFIVAL